MTAEHKDIIQSKFDQLVKLSAEAVMDYLVSRGVMDLEEMSNISTKDTREQKARGLITLLVRKNDDVFYFLIEALKESSKPGSDLANILESAGRLIYQIGKCSFIWKKMKVMARFLSHVKKRRVCQFFIDLHQ